MNGLQVLRIVWRRCLACLICREQVCQLNAPDMAITGTQDTILCDLDGA